MLLDKINLEKLSNKLLYLLSQKSSIFKYCLTILVVMILFIAWLFLLVRPLNAKLIASRAKLKQLNSLKNICSQSYDQCADLSQKIEHLDSKINKKINIMGNSSAYLSLGKVIDCINCNGVTLIDYSPGKVEKLPKTRNIHVDNLETDSTAGLTAKAEFGKKVTFELTLEGTFLNMFNFFKCLSAVKYCLKYSQISINKNEQGLIGCKLLLDILQVSK